MNASPDTRDREREDLIGTLARHRSFLRQTVAGISDEDAGRRTTISELCLGGLIKHVASVERGWTDFIEHGPAGMGLPDEGGVERYQAGFRMLPGETLEAPAPSLRRGWPPHRTAGGDAPLARRLPSPARGALVRARGQLVGSTRLAAHPGRDRPARRPRRHHPGSPRRVQDHGLSPGPARITPG